MDNVRTDAGRHPVAQVCDRCGELLDELGQPALWSASDTDIADIVRAAEQVTRRAAAVQAFAVGWPGRWAVGWRRRAPRWRPGPSTPIRRR